MKSSGFCWNVRERVTTRCAVPTRVVTAALVIGVVISSLASANGTWEDQREVRAAERELERVPEQSRPEFALQRCRSALSDVRPTDPSTWCLLAYRSFYSVVGGSEEATLAAAWVEMLEGEVGPHLVSSRPIAWSDTTGSLRLRRWAYSTIFLARINRSLERDAYKVMAEFVGIKDMAQSGMHEQRVAILHELVGKKLHGDDLWVAATIAATHRYNFTRDMQIDSATRRARTVELLGLINQLSYDRALLDRIDRAATIIIDRARAELLEVDSLEEASQLRRTTAQTCGALLWENADICRDSRYRAAQDAAREETLKRHPERRAMMAEHRKVKPTLVGGQTKNETTGPIEACRAVYLVDLTRDGTITHLREFYSDPPRACTKAASAYFAALRYQEQSDERPDEIRTDLVQPFQQFSR